MLTRLMADGPLQVPPTTVSPLSCTPPSAPYPPARPFRSAVSLCVRACIEMCLVLAPCRSVYICVSIRVHG